MAQLNTGIITMPTTSAFPSQYGSIDPLAGYGFPSTGQSGTMDPLGGSFIIPGSQSGTVDPLGGPFTIPNGNQSGTVDPLGGPFVWPGSQSGSVDPLGGPFVWPGSQSGTVEPLGGPFTFPNGAQSGTVVPLGGPIGAITGSQYGTLDPMSPLSPIRADGTTGTVQSIGGGPTTPVMSGNINPLAPSFQTGVTTTSTPSVDPAKWAALIDALKALEAYLLASGVQPLPAA